MNFIKTYIQNFLNRAGSYVFVATVIARLLSFLASWIALQLINNEELGIVLYAWNIISFLIPFLGFGLTQSLIRYGAITKSTEDKKSLLKYVYKNGFYASILLTIVVAILALLFPFEFEKSNIYIALLSLVFVPFFMFETLKAQLRLAHNNKKFSLIEAVYAVVSIFLVFILGCLFKEKGYIAALIFTPIITCLVFFKNFKIPKTTIKKPSFINKNFWKYGFFASLTSVVSQFLLGIDILLIGNLSDSSEMVTQYRYISILPLSILFLPRVFINTDFVAFTANIYNKAYIYKYIKGYIAVFSLVSFGLISLSFLFSEEILAFFDTDFKEFGSSLIILFLGVSSILMLRGLFGNLLCSIGKINTNLYIALIAIAFNSIGNYFLIPKYGIIGAATTSAISMWFTSIASTLCFFYLYKKFLVEKPE